MDIEPEPAEWIGGLIERVEGVHHHQQAMMRVKPSLVRLE